MPLGVIFFYLLGEDMGAAVGAVAKLSVGASAVEATGISDFAELFSGIQEGKAVVLNRMNELYAPVLNLINNKTDPDFLNLIKAFTDQKLEAGTQAVFFLESFPMSVLVEGATGRSQAVFLKRSASGQFSLDEDALVRNDAHRQDRAVRIGRFDVEKKENDSKATISFVDKEEGFIAQGKLCNAVAAAIFGDKIVLLNPDPDGSDASQFKAPGGAVEHIDYINAVDAEGKVDYKKMFALAAIRELLEECFGFKKQQSTAEFYKTLKENNTIKIGEVEYTVQAYDLLELVKLDKTELYRLYGIKDLKIESNGFCCSPTVILKLNAKTQSTPLPKLVPEEGCGVPEYKILTEVVDGQNAINYRGLDTVLSTFYDMHPDSQKHYQVLFGEAALPV